MKSLETVTMKWQWQWQWQWNSDNNNEKLGNPWSKLFIAKGSGFHSWQPFSFLPWWFPWSQCRFLLLSSVQLQSDNIQNIQQIPRMRLICTILEDWMPVVVNKTFTLSELITYTIWAKFVSKRVNLFIKANYLGRFLISN